LDIERSADVILASEIQFERRLGEALQYAKARRRLTSLPCAYVEMTKALREDADLPPSEESLRSISQVVSQSVNQFIVKAADVEVEVLNDCIRCNIYVSGGAWLFAVLEALAQATKDKGGGLERGDPSGIHRAFHEAGAVEALAVKLTPRFALDRVDEELRLLDPEYGQKLRGQQADHLFGLVSAARKAYGEAWAELFHEETEDIDGLMQKTSMSTFDGKLLLSEEGRKHGLREEVLAHDANTLPDLMADAVDAHHSLKEALAPRIAWASSEFTDVYEVPLKDERRTWQSTPANVAPCGTHYDPGLKDERDVFETAKAAQRPEQLEPAWRYQMDISRIIISFEKVHDVCTALERMVTHLAVVWIDNGFISQDSTGYRYVSVGVRQRGKSERTHICTVELHLKALMHVRDVEGDKCQQQVKSLLAACGVKPRALEKVRSLVMQELTCTRWQAARARECDFVFATDAAKEIMQGSIGENETLLVEKLVVEVSELAIASGVPAEWVVVDSTGEQDEQPEL